MEPTEGCYCGGHSQFCKFFAPPDPWATHDQFSTKTLLSRKYTPCENSDPGPDFVGTDFRVTEPPKDGPHRDGRAVAATLFVYTLVASTHYSDKHITLTRPRTRPHTHKPHFHPTRRHSHLPSDHTVNPAPHSHLYFGYKLPVPGVPLGSADHSCYSATLPHKPLPWGTDNTRSGDTGGGFPTLPSPSIGGGRMIWALECF